MHNSNVFKILQIDAIIDSDDGHWSWNDSYLLESDLFIAESSLTPRKILRMLREREYLSEQSKGRLIVDMSDAWDGLFVICDNATKRPILALSEIH